MSSLPFDCTLLPLFKGALLVFPGKAVFCNIPPEEVENIRRVLDHKQSVEELSESLKNSLKEHSFFSSHERSKIQAPKIQIQLTNACNLNCTYCCTNSKNARTGELDENAIFKILFEIKEFLGAGTQVSFLGGEPFLVPFTTRLAKEALSLGLKLSIFSNGLPLADNDFLAKEVAELTKQGALLRISLAAASKEPCDLLSGEERFERAIAALNNLSKNGGKAFVDVMLMPQNASDMALAFNSLKKRVPEQFKISLGILYLSGREKGVHLFDSRHSMEQALTDIAFGAGEIIEAAHSQPVMSRRDGCDCAIGMNLNIRSDGSLFPCFKMEERIGHISELGVTDALKKIRDNPHPAYNLKTCRNCPLNTLCGGGCRSDNFLFTGTEEPLCGSWRVQVLGELLAEDCVSAVNWSLPHLHAEALRRGIDAPETLKQVQQSRHCIEI
ncbi:MAG: radical SAM protein [Deltaproteobacteria bacterium]|nr:radical SAM protein [Deltaproteobacteria bacterium]